MSAEFMRETLKRVVAVICHEIGFENADDECLNILRDILHDYLLGFGKTLKIHTENCRRDQPSFFDLLFVLKFNNYDINSLVNYMRYVKLASLSEQPLPVLPVQKRFREIRPKPVTSTSTVVSTNHTQAMDSQKMVQSTEPLISDVKCLKKSSLIPKIQSRKLLEKSTQSIVNSQRVKTVKTTFKFPNFHSCKKYFSKLKKFKKPSYRCITLNFCDRKFRKKIMNENIRRRGIKLTEVGMYTLRRCIELDNRQRQMKIIARCSNNAANRLLNKFIEYQTKASYNYSKRIQKLMMQRIACSLPNTNVCEDDTLYLDDIVTQDIDIGYSVTVDTSSDEMSDNEVVGVPLKNDGLSQNNNQNIDQNGNKLMHSLNANNLQNHCSVNILGKNIAVNERLFKLISVNNLEVTVLPPVRKPTGVVKSEYEIIRSGPTSVTLKRNRIWSAISDKENNHHNADLDNFESLRKRKKRVQ